jgi:hypothetical protein
MDKTREGMGVVSEGKLTCPRGKGHQITEFTETHIWCHECQMSISTLGEGGENG